MKKIILALTSLALAASISAASPKATTDAEITNAIMTVNTQEMNMAKAARSNAENPKVKEFAENMFKEHSKNNDKAQALARQQKFNLKETKSSMKFKFASEDKVDSLKMLKGKEFDREYMNTQVNMHKEVIEKLDSTLIPNAESPELKAMLQETRTNVQGHLKHAESIQKSL